MSDFQNPALPIEFLSSPFRASSIGEEEIAEAVDTLRSGWLTTCPKVQRVE